MLDKFKIGHADNDNTGVTVILSEGGATGGVHVMGGAPATRETDLLKSGNTVQKSMRWCLRAVRHTGLRRRPASWNI